MANTPKAPKLNTEPPVAAEPPLEKEGANETAPPTNEAPPAENTVLPAEDPEPSFESPSNDPDVFKAEDPEPDAEKQPEVTELSDAEPEVEGALVPIYIESTRTEHLSETTLGGAIRKYLEGSINGQKYKVELDKQVMVPPVIFDVLKHLIKKD